MIVLSMLRPINGHRHLLAGVNITEHAVKRYRERRGWLNFQGLPGFTDEQEIRMLLGIAEPCYGIPERIREERSARHGALASYWHSGPWRLVIIPAESTLCTIEPDIHEHDFGVWRDIEEAIHPFELHGFTVEEITGGVIRSAYR